MIVLFITHSTRYRYQFLYLYSWSSTDHSLRPRSGRSSSLFNMFSKEWPHVFADSRKPVDERPVLEARIALLRSSGVEPADDDLQLFMESYDDDLTSLDLRNAMQYLQINECSTLHGFCQAERRESAWLDDRTFDRPVSTMAIDNVTMRIHQTIHRTGHSELANIRALWELPTTNATSLM
jgi:hypothetical protein